MGLAHNARVLTARHIPALDGVRGIAILLVLAHHFEISTETHTGAIGKVLAACEYGWAGVPLFFVLSGYLITRILCSTRGETGYYRRFYARRILRIFPLYYGTLIFTILVLPPLLGVAPPSGTLWLWIYGSNLPYTFPQLHGESGGVANYSHFWSLAVEEQFYFVWPLLVANLSGASLKRVALGSIAVALASRAALQAIEPNALGADYFTLSNVDALGIGAYVAIREHESGLAALRKDARIALVLGVSLVPVIASWRSWHGGEPDHVLKRTAFALVFGAFIYGAITARGAFRWVLCAPWLRRLGKYSYAMYVLHFLPPFVRNSGAGWVARYVPNRALADVLWMIGGIALTYAAGWTSWQVFEKHWLTLKNRFSADVQPFTLERAPE